MTAYGSSRYDINPQKLSFDMYFPNKMTSLYEKSFFHLEPSEVGFSVNVQDSGVFFDQLLFHHKRVISPQMCHMLAY